MADSTSTPTAKQPPPAKPAGQPPHPSPPPQAPPPGLDADRHRAAQDAAHAAEVIAAAVIPACLAAVLSKGGALFDSHAARVYLDRVLADYGGPADPTARALIEQFHFAHVRAAQLHVQAAAADHVDRVKVLNAAAARLHAEIRRTAVVLDELLRKRPAGPRLKVAKTG
jgi:hypothetical protein